MVPILAYLLDAARFPEADPEGMFIALMRVFLPWTAAGLGALAVTSREPDPATGLIPDGQEPYGIHVLGGNHSCIEAPYMVYNRETGYCNLFLSLGGQDVDTVEHVSVPLEFGGDHTVTGGMNGSFGYDGEGRVSPPGRRRVPRFLRRRL